MRLPRTFFEQDTTTVAAALLGCRLVRREPDGALTVGRIVETEAYCGYSDPACHSYKGKSERTRAMFGPRGHAYIYLIYGMYHCFNVTSGPPGEPEAVLIRALEPIEGLDRMSARRGGPNAPRQLMSGPGKLCIALDIHRGLYGLDLVEGTELYLEAPDHPPAVTAAKRINIGYAGEAADYLWRYCVKDSPFVSVKPR